MIGQLESESPNVISREMSVDGSASGNTTPIGLSNAPTPVDSKTTTPVASGRTSPVVLDTGQDEKDKTTDNDKMEVEESIEKDQVKPKTEAINKTDVIKKETKSIPIKEIEEKEPSKSEETTRKTTKEDLSTIKSESNLNKPKEFSKLTKDLSETKLPKTSENASVVSDKTKCQVIDKLETKVAEKTDDNECKEEKSKQQKDIISKTQVPPALKSKETPNLNENVQKSESDKKPLAEIPEKTPKENVIKTTPKPTIGAEKSTKSINETILKLKKDQNESKMDKIIPKPESKVSDLNLKQKHIESSLMSKVDELKKDANISSSISKDTKKEPIFSEVKSENNVQIQKESNKEASSMVKPNNILQISKSCKEVIKPSVDKPESTLQLSKNIDKDIVSSVSKTDGTSQLLKDDKKEIVLSESKQESASQSSKDSKKEHVSSESKQELASQLSKDSKKEIVPSETKQELESQSSKDNKKSVISSLTKPENASKIKEAGNVSKDELKSDKLPLEKKEHIDISKVNKSPDSKSISEKNISKPEKMDTIVSEVKKESDLNLPKKQLDISKANKDMDTKTHDLSVKINKPVNPVETSSKLKESAHEITKPSSVISLTKTTGLSQLQSQNNPIKLSVNQTSAKPLDKDSETNSPNKNVQQKPVSKDSPDAIDKSVQGNEKKIISVNKGPITLKKPNESKSCDKTTIPEKPNIDIKSKSVDKAAIEPEKMDVDVKTVPLGSSSIIKPSESSGIKRELGRDEDKSLTTSPTKNVESTPKKIKLVRSPIKKDDSHKETEPQSNTKPRITFPDGDKTSGANKDDDSVKDSCAASTSVIKEKSDEVKSTSIDSVKSPCDKKLRLNSQDENSDKPKSAEDVGETIEEPVMVVKGDGEGASCQSPNPYFDCTLNSSVSENFLTKSYRWWEDFSHQNSRDSKEVLDDVVVHDVMYFFGEGNGVDCDAGNSEDEEKTKTEKSGNDIQQGSLKDIKNMKNSEQKEVMKEKCDELVSQNDSSNKPLTQSKSKQEPEDKKHIENETVNGLSSPEDSKSPQNKPDVDEKETKDTNKSLNGHEDDSIESKEESKTSESKKNDEKEEKSTQNKNQNDSIKERKSCKKPEESSADENNDNEKKSDLNSNKDSKGCEDSPKEKLEDTSTSVDKKEEISDKKAETNEEESETENTKENDDSKLETDNTEPVVNEKPKPRKGRPPKSSRIRTPRPERSRPKPEKITSEEERSK